MSVVHFKNEETHCCTKGRRLDEPQFPMPQSATEGQGPLI